MAKEFDFNLAISNADAINKEIDAGIHSKLIEAMDTLATATYAHGVGIISKKLKTTQLDYLNNFKLLSPDLHTRVIQLDPQVGYLEDGYSSFDIKPGLLNGPKSKQSQSGGRYNTVPFSHKGEGAATNLAQQLMAIELQQALKKGQDRLGRPTDLTKMQPGQGIVGTASTDSSHHANIQGAVRIQKQYNKATQSTFIVFRRVSTNTDKNKWIHPGYQGVHVFPDMEAFAENNFNEILRKITV